MIPKTKAKYIPFYILSKLPFSVLYGLSNIIYLIMYHIVKYRRDIVGMNIKSAFPNKNENDIRAIEKKFYRHFCDVMVESLKILTIRKFELKKRFHVKNPELIQKFYAENKSIVLYAAHQGNWEWVSFLPLFIPHKLIALYKPQRNKYYDELMKAIRQRFGMLCIPAKKGYKTISNFNKNNILTMNYIVGDQNPKKVSSKHWVHFLNQNTPFLVGADRIAKKSNQVVIFPSLIKKRRGYYELEFKVIEDDAAKTTDFHIIEDYAKLLEQSIIQSPELWFWSHRRWQLPYSQNNTPQVA